MHLFWLFVGPSATRLPETYRGKFPHEAFQLRQSDSLSNVSRLELRERRLVQLRVVLSILAIHWFHFYVNCGLSWIGFLRIRRWV